MHWNEIQTFVKRLEFCIEVLWDNWLVHWGKQKLRSYFSLNTKINSSRLRINEYENLQEHFWQKPSVCLSVWVLFLSTYITLVTAVV